MQRKNLPLTDTRYWMALFVASLMGTISGDYVANNLGLGFGTGSIPLLILFFLILGIERKAKIPNEFYYWLAIVLTRTAATNLADLATHNLKIEYWLVATCLTSFLIAILFVGRFRSPNRGLQRNMLPDTNFRYWVAIIIASILGTTLGDFVSEGLEMGFAKGTLLLGGLLAVVMITKSRAKSSNEAFYWVAVVILRTAGTTTGDFISNPEGLNLGFAVGALAMGVLLVAVLNFQRIWASLFRTIKAD